MTHIASILVVELLVSWSAVLVAGAAILYAVFGRR